MDAKTLLLAALVVIMIGHVVFWYATVSRRRAAQGATAPDVRPTPLALAIGFVANFFDTLGIGSYATTTAMARAWKVMPDELIPGTLNVGYVVPTVVQALIYITIFEVEFTTLVTIIAAAVIGAYLGAGVVAGLPRRGRERGPVRGPLNFLLEHPDALWRGIPFAAALLFILTPHVLGHYLLSRIHRVPASLRCSFPGCPISSERSVPSSEYAARHESPRTVRYRGCQSAGWVHRCSRRPDRGAESFDGRGSDRYLWIATRRAVAAPVSGMACDRAYLAGV